MGVYVDERLKEFTKCFPMLAAQNKEMFEAVYENTRAKLAEQLLVRYLPHPESKSMELISRRRLVLLSKLNDLGQL
jgi:hypothetical protein